MTKKKIKRDRKVRKGMDITKFVKIWRVLESVKWIHISGIAEKTGINQVTVRYYLDHYFYEAIEENKFPGGIKLRMVKLKPGVNIERYLEAREWIKEIREDMRSANSKNNK